MTKAIALRISSNQQRGQRNGMALLVVVVLVMLIALGAYRFSFYMESQYRMTRLHEEQVHARLAAISGLELAAAMVEMPATQRMSLGGLLDNASVFRDIAVDATITSSSANRDPNAWRFCLISPQAMDGPVSNPLSSSQSSGTPSLPIRFGLENESAKLPIPTLIAWDQRMPGHARTTLMGLPGVSDTMVDAWLREFGVSGRVDKGGSQDQLGSLDELRQAWFGGDLNQNYQLDPLELRLASQLMNRNKGTQPQPLMGSTNPVGGFKPLQRYVTWVSGHRNATRDGQPRIYLNDPDLQSLHRQLSLVWSADWANFVIAMRQFGPSNGASNAPIPSTPKATDATSPTTSTSKSQSPISPSPPITPITPSTPSTPSTPNQASSATTAIATVELAQDWTPDFGKTATFSFQSPLDLIGAVVDFPAVSTSNPSNSPTNQTSPAKRTLRNPFSGDLSEVRNYLGRMLDDVTVELSPISEGRIDVTEAPVEVLAGIPGLDLLLAQRIVQHRSGSTKPSGTTQEQDTIAWLVDVVDLAKLKELEPYLTCRSDVYSVQAIGYRDNQSAVYRTTATIDSRRNPTQFRNQKVWHPWDRGFSIEQLADSKP